MRLGAEPRSGPRASGPGASNLAVRVPGWPGKSGRLRGALSASSRVGRDTSRATLPALGLGPKGAPQRLGPMDQSPESCSSAEAARNSNYDPQSRLPGNSGKRFVPATRLGAARRPTAPPHNTPDYERLLLARAADGTGPCQHLVHRPCEQSRPDSLHAGPAAALHAGPAAARSRVAWTGHAPHIRWRDGDRMMDMTCLRLEKLAIVRDDDFHFDITDTWDREAEDRDVLVSLLSIRKKGNVLLHVRTSIF